MEKSHCYNPFVYIKSDNDVQKLATNLFKSTTPKGSTTNDPFWDTAASMLLLALIFYLKYEAPEEEQNFVMVMELLRAGDVKEDDDDYVSPLDMLFNNLETRSPEHIALKYYRSYHSGSAKTKFIIYTTDDGQVDIEVRLEDENVWLTQNSMSELFNTTKQNKSLYDNYKQKYDKMLVATSENNSPFYVKHGFDKYEKTIKNYFIDNYDE